MRIDYDWEMRGLGIASIMVQSILAGEYKLTDEEKEAYNDSLLEEGIEGSDEMDVFSRINDFDDFSEDEWSWD